MTVWRPLLTTTRATSSVFQSPLTASRRHELGSWSKFGNRFASFRPTVNSSSAYAKESRSIRLFTTSLRADFNPNASPEIASSSESKIEVIHPDSGSVFDRFIQDSAQEALRQLSDNRTRPGIVHATVSTLHSQYLDRAGQTIDLVVPYEELPRPERRADAIRQPRTSPSGSTREREGEVGDGLVLIVHALLRIVPDNVSVDSVKVEKVTVCSGFAIKAEPISEEQKDRGDVLVTCAHTLEEMHRYIERLPAQQRDQHPSFSFAIPSEGRPRLITGVLSSMPRSDLMALETSRLHPRSEVATPVRNQEARSRSDLMRAAPLRTLPLTPFPVHRGDLILTHLFGSPSPAVVKRSIARRPTPRSVANDPAGKEGDERIERGHTESLEKPIDWFESGQHSAIAWRRWGSGHMLGYRSYTGLEVEAGIHSSLPHILTSILPTSGSSGGPLVNAATGAVVGTISGRRMDNRVEGERGWGSSAEGIYEMFSLPGFASTSPRG